MEQVTIGDVEPWESGGDATARGLSAILGAEHVAVNHYAVDPGDRVSGLHAHGDQEELFVVLEGTATVETLEGDVEVAAGEAIRFAPGEYQSVTNDTTRELEVLAIGAPSGPEDIRIPLACPECSHEYREPVLTDSGPVLVCPECSTEAPANCSACGGEDLYAALGPKGEPVSVCADCGATTEPT